MALANFQDKIFRSPNKSQKASLKKYSKSSSEKKLITKNSGKSQEPLVDKHFFKRDRTENDYENWSEGSFAADTENLPESYEDFSVSEHNSIYNEFPKRLIEELPYFPDRLKKECRS